MRARWLAGLAVAALFATSVDAETLGDMEIGRRDFEARFGAGLPSRAIEPAVVRALFGPRRAP